MGLRSIKIRKYPNPTGLSLAERELCVDLLRSLKRSTDREVLNLKERRGLPWWHEFPDWQMQAIRESVLTAAMNQLTGRQKTPGRLFALEREVPMDDLAYVRESLGVTS